jgi:uncharacterized protein YciI
MVLDASSLKEARALAEGDPLLVQGPYASMQIQRWNWSINKPKG